MTFFLMALLTGFSLPATEDWVVIASHQEAAIGVDRTSVRRSDGTVSATVLMGMFVPETPPGTSAQMQYYLSDETIDCAAVTRVEHAVRIYSPEDVLLGTTAPDPEPGIRSGSMYGSLHQALCDAESGLAGDGHATPLIAIQAEAAERRATGRAVND